MTHSAPQRHVEPEQPHAPNRCSLGQIVPGVERHPLKKLDADEEALLKLLHRWRNEAGQAGREIRRIVVAYEAGRDGF